MKSKRAFLIFPLLFLFSTAMGQHFTGIVLDKETRDPIPYAQVYFVDLRTGTTTDEKGMFTVGHLQRSTLHVQISYMGYNSIDEVINTATTKEKTFYLEPGSYDLEEVVVAAPFGRLQGENIVSIAHKKISDLEETSPTTLAEAISNIPGVDEITTGAGIGKPVIRGLSGNRIVTYAQGVRIENQQWGDEHGLGVGDAGIEGVEVIKGPASLLYGSDALGGVLYFIDERYAKYNRVEGSLRTKFLSNTLGTVSDAGIRINQGKLKFNLSGAYASHADYQVPGRERVYNSRFNEKSINSAVGFNTKYWISNIRYSYLQNHYGIVEDADYTRSTQRTFILPFQKINNHNLSIENTVFTGDSKLNLTLGYTNNYRREFEDDRDHQALGLKLNTYTYNLKWYSPTYDGRFDFIIGSQGMAQDNKNNGAEILIPDATTIDAGIFVLGNLSLEKFRLQGGIRADHRHIDTKQMISEDVHFPAFKDSYDGITFSGGAIRKTHRTTLRANISSGFRAPNTSELLSDGVQPGTNRYVIGDPDLRNEKAIQADLGLEYRDECLYFSVNPFYNAIRHYIFLAPTDSVIDNRQVFRYLQTNAFLYGGEASFHYRPRKARWLLLESDLSTVFGEDRDNNPLPFIPQTEINTTLRFAFPQGKKVQIKNIFVQYMYKFRQQRTALYEEKSDGYGLLNAGMRLVIPAGKNAFEIVTGIRNMLNTKYTDHLSRFKTLRIPNPGIVFYAGVSFTFSREIKNEKP